ncbi:MAG: 5-oxoprolinase/urea amidolyase family protein, partial [Verrucomicrobiota bacterium]
GARGAGLAPSGHAIQARIYAEDPNKDFQPSSGLVTHFAGPRDMRCDTWIESGVEVPSFYDPMVAKVIAHCPTRGEAIASLKAGLEEFACYGIETNLAYLGAILEAEAFVNGRVTTQYLNGFEHVAQTIDVLSPGLEATVQDYPGRIGMWDVGVPPSGPFDALSFRLGNRVLGNDEKAAGIEMSVRGAKLRFNAGTTICLTGADMGAVLDGEAVAMFEPIRVAAGQVLKLGDIVGAGQRGYLLVSGGIDVPEYLGSRATFRLGRFGGHGGRALKAGDVLHVNGVGGDATGAGFDLEGRPELTRDWELRVVYGPHGAPEFFTEADIEMFFGASWEVHYNSDRTGVRLIGPKPEWARRDGGEAGLHPSNIHDNAYCVGSVDFTGDMPILLGPDGPSLGGFVCPAVVARADLWKLGQLKPGDGVRFVSISNEDAEVMLEAQERAVATLGAGGVGAAVESKRTPPILDSIPERDGLPEVCFRQSGDGVILVEFGDMVLDLDLRFRVQALHDRLEGEPFEGMLELVPGIRSLQIQFDPTRIHGKEVLKLIEEVEAGLPPVEEMAFASRVVHMPLSWDDPATQEAIEKYMQIVRADAPWCPSNIEFIRRINGLESVEDVRRIVYEASYFVMGLGDVYLGAPVATPLDPRHRLVTTKYNPARTWTPENAVGIGGAYLCIYGMEGPGGYQFVGRTLPVWNRFRETGHFEAGKPWLLRFFDQVRWFPVEAEELLEMRRDFLTGHYDIEVEETVFRPVEYHGFLEAHAESIAVFRERQREAFSEERERWEASGAMSFEVEEVEMPPEDEAVEVPTGCEAVTSPVAGSLWKVEVKEGDVVSEDELVLAVESMKMEIAVMSPEAGRVREVLVGEGESVSAGQVLVIVEVDET